MPTDVVSLQAIGLTEVKRALRRRLQLVAEGVHQTKVFVVVNGKGGVGKSSLSAALAAAWAAIGLRVLLIEMDEQGNNGEDLGTTGTVLADDGEAQAAAILDGKPLTPTGEARPGLFVVPGGAVLEDVIEELYCQRRLASRCESPEDQSAWMGMYAAAIDAVRDLYDVIVLDVAPGSEPLQLQALAAGDFVLVPSKSDPSSRKGLRTVARRFGQARALNPMLRLLGVVIFGTNASATNIQTKIKGQLEEDLNGAAPVFDQTIRHVEAAAVACRLAGRVAHEMRSSTAIEPSVRRSMKALAGDYQSLAIEIMQAKTALDRGTRTESEAA
ncbi:ParA family protein [Streptomyces sp. NBC_01669]|uniref:ParA family protein n=1 Tax=Streptomyces sp. NBC_01669 TaxID=2975909 RepID=UPI0022528F44|nr:ParA family protein [Streptomyces sp. NBC_01669]MCX4538550.1 ParA family protein [Streptomyces sp. NBC_01669]